MENNETDIVKINKNLRFLIMPDFVYADSELNDTSRRIYCFIHTFKGEYFFFSNDHLAKMFNCSEWSISQAVSQLEELNYIHTTYRQKAGGGKIRYIKDMKFEFINEWTVSQHWENPKSKIGKTQSGDEAVKIGKTQSGSQIETAVGNDNIINENNIKEDFENWKETKRERRASKGKQKFGWTSQPKSKSQPSYEKFPVRRRGGITFKGVV